MDAYQAIRSLAFPALASVLGIEINQFKRRPNGEYYGPCPLRPSKINQTCFSFADTGVYHCFSCNGKGRGGIDLAMAVKDVSFKAAVEEYETAPGLTASRESGSLECSAAWRLWAVQADGLRSASAFQWG